MTNSNQHIKFKAESIIRSAQKSNVTIPSDFGLDIDFLKSLSNSQLLYGDSMVFVTRFPDLHVCYVSKEVKEILGIELNDFPLTSMFQSVYPDDQNFIIACEDKIFHFLFESGMAEYPEKYKVIYTLRIKDKAGKYHQFIKQAFCARHKETKELNYAIHIMTKSSHLRLANRHIFSIIHMSGGQSYYNLDPFKDHNTYLKEQLSVYTKTEIMIISLIAEGLTTNEVAQRLTVSVGTVRTHRRNILKKSGLKNMTTVVLGCLKSGII